MARVGHAAIKALEAAARHHTLATMIGYSTIVFFAVVQVISSQGPPPFANIPEKCRGPPPVAEKPHECCKVEPFFEPSDFADCGYKKLGEEGFKDGPPDCSKQICLMKKYNLATGDDTVDFEAVKKFLDVYAEKYPAFQSAIEKAKQCVKEDLPGPPKICLANRMVFCIGSVVMFECPADNWTQSDGCKTLKEHMAECKPFFQKQ